MAKYTDDISKELVDRWSNPNGLVNEILGNQFMLEKSLFSRYWISESAQKDAGNVILDLLDNDFPKEHGLSMIYYSPELYHTKLADDEVNNFQIINYDKEYYITHKDDNKEQFRIKKLFNIIIDDPEASPVFLFEVITTKSHAGGLIGFTVNQYQQEKVANIISGCLNVIRMSSKDHTEIHSFKLEPKIEELLKDLEAASEEMVDNNHTLSDPVACLLISVGLNKPVEDDYYKKQLSRVVELVLQERSKVGK